MLKLIKETFKDQSYPLVARVTKFIFIWNILVGLTVVLTLVFSATGIDMMLKPFLVVNYIYRFLEFGSVIVLLQVVFRRASANNTSSRQGGSSAMDLSLSAADSKLDPSSPSVA
jgi:hypothetical protein